MWVEISSRRVNILLLSFSGFTSEQLYEVLALRQRVFMIEQERYYLDCDGLDKIATHVLVYDNETLAGYLRILPPGVSYDTAAIGRVVIDKKYRGKGVGQQLMKAALAEIAKQWDGAVTLSAQIQTIDFYKKFGFMTVGEPYEEAFTPHVKMVKKSLVSF